jgi:GT2 family glycosyltransferase
MPEPQVTIVVVPRERFSHTERTLENIYEQTTIPFNLVYVSGKSPARIQRYLQLESQRRGFRLIPTAGYLAPNQARNLGIREANTKYTVFLDNDALVSPGWLEALVQCAEETGAWVVGPVYFIGEFEKQIIHMAGATVHFKDRDGKRVLYEEQYHLDTPLAALPDPLLRRPCDHLEFHCLLVRTEVFSKLGPLDEGLLSVHEHIDFCMTVRRAGGAVYLEPKSRTTYVPPPPCTWWDLPFFMLRWSEDWNVSTVRHFNSKWDVSSVVHIDDTSNSAHTDTALRFARGHRRLMTGLRISETDEDRPISILDQAELMIAMFQSVDRETFDLIWTSPEGGLTESSEALTHQTLTERLSLAIDKMERNELTVMIKPRPPKLPQDPALVCLDHLSGEKMQTIKPFAFLTLEVEPGQYQCWLAIDQGTWRDAASLRRLGKLSKDVAAGSTVHLAGSHNGKGSRVRLVEACAGLMNTIAGLENRGVVPLIRNCLIY